MKSLARLRCSFLLVALGCVCVCVGANRTDVSRVTPGNKRSPSTAPRVRVILDHGPQSGAEESSFPASRQSAYAESRVVQNKQRWMLNQLINNNHWNPEMMRISDADVVSAKKSFSSCKLPKELEEQLNRTDYTVHDKDGPRVLNQSIVERIKMYLSCMASCPVTHTWEDLGEAFFPRFYRRGFCSNDRPCSWPPGMRCKVNETAPIAIYQKKCAGETAAISLVNSNGTRVSDSFALPDKRRNNDLRSATSGTRSATAERRNKNDEGRKKRLKGANSNSNSNSNSQQDNKQNKKGNKKKEQNQRGKKRDAPGSVNKAVDNCNWDLVLIQVTTRCVCSCS